MLAELTTRFRGTLNSWATVETNSDFMRLRFESVASRLAPERSRSMTMTPMKRSRSSFSLDALIPSGILPPPRMRQLNSLSKT